MDGRYFLLVDSETVERSVKSLGKEFEARNIGAAILKVNSKLKSSSMRAKLHPLSTQPGFISDICCKEETKCQENHHSNEPVSKIFHIFDEKSKPMYINQDGKDHC